LAEEFLRAAEDQGAMGPALVARRAVGFTQYGHGELTQSQSNLSQVCELYDAERDRGLAFQFGQDNLPAALAALSIVTWLLGDVDNAQQMRDSAITRANDIGHAPTLAYARTFAGCMFSVICRDWHSAREHGAALLAFTEQHRLPLWHAWANLYHSRAVAELVPAQTDVTQMQKALAETQATGTRRNITLHLALLAEVYGLCDQVTNGLAVIEKALAEVDLTDEHWWEAEIHRVKGELLLSLGIENAADAEACFERAMAISRAQAAKSLELRATISLARLWKDSGRKGDAVGLLEPICGWFKQKSNCANTWDALEVLDGV
jgi:predicted ATPase